MIAQRLFVCTLLVGLLLGCGDSSGDPYLNLDDELRVELRSFVVPRDHDLLSDRTRTWGVPFEMYSAKFKEGGNLVEIGVRFAGGCGTHRFSLYAYDTYADQASTDTPLDITLYLYHSQQEEDCNLAQDHVLRTMDLSFLHPGRYNIKIENSFDRASFLVQDYEVR